MSDKAVIQVENIESKIYTIRGYQVMLDEDLASLYGVETRILNQAAKRNKERFPKEFSFQLTDTELEILRSQFVTSSWGGRRYLPYVFTEQGIAMLSAVLKGDTAVKVSVQIMNAFVAMRRFILANAQVFQRLDTLEIKQIETDNKIHHIFNAIESRDIKPKEGIFYDGQIFDAYAFVSDLIKTVKKSIVLIDNYIDESVLALFSKRKKNVSLTILTKNVSAKLKLDAEKFNQQYPPLELKVFSKAHDRFLIIDSKEVSMLINLSGNKC